MDIRRDKMREFMKAKGGKNGKNMFKFRNMMSKKRMRKIPNHNFTKGG